jgi:hypothetical protein
MVRFAKAIGAMRNERPDWYAVAEYLAESYAPHLLGDLPASRPAHRPRQDWYWLARDVGLVMQQENCTIKEACRLLAEGKAFPNVVNLPNGGSARLQAGKWRGKNPDTLEQRYFEYTKEWKEICAEGQRTEAPLAALPSITAAVRARHRRHRAK